MIPSARDIANMEAFVERAKYGIWTGPNRGCGLFWTEANTRQTGRSPWDVFDFPNENDFPVVFGDCFAADCITVLSHTWPSVSFVEECEPSHIVEWMDEFTLSEPDLETEIVRIWERLMRESRFYPLVADALMVLIAETEGSLQPIYQRVTFPSGEVREIERMGPEELHLAANTLWERMLRGASATVVLDVYLELSTRFSVNESLAKGQRSLLQYLMTDRGPLLVHAKKLEAAWRSKHLVRRTESLAAARHSHDAFRAVAYGLAWKKGECGSWQRNDSLRGIYEKATALVGCTPYRGKDDGFQAFRQRFSKPPYDHPPPDSS